MAGQGKTKSGPAGGVARNPNLARMVRPDIALDDLWERIQQADPTALGRAVSLVESTRAGDRQAASILLDRCAALGRAADRIAISGAPGVGKSTLIDALGSSLAEEGKRVAVLAVDPTSARSGGSVLGDKTRMPKLAALREAFIRPSPSGGILGGVARHTRPAVSLCEAAGFDVVLIETVGVGQSETAARTMCDFFLLLSLAGAGDELQGIKRGILEVADLVAVNKADGENLEAARAAAGKLRTALHHLPPDDSGWTPRVVLSSGVSQDGLDGIRAVMDEHREHQVRTGARETMRAEQRVIWFREELLAIKAEQLQRDLPLDTHLTRIRQGLEHPYSAAFRLAGQADRA